MTAVARGDEEETVKLVRALLACDADVNYTAPVSPVPVVVIGRRLEHHSVCPRTGVVSTNLTECCASGRALVRTQVDGPASTGTVGCITAGASCVDGRGVVAVWQDGRTALSICCQSRFVAIATVLLERGANPKECLGQANFDESQGFSIHPWDLTIPY